MTAHTFDHWLTAQKKHSSAVRDLSQNSVFRGDSIAKEAALLTKEAKVLKGLVKKLKKVDKTKVMENVFRGTMATGGAMLPGLIGTATGGPAEGAMATLSGLPFFTTTKAVDLADKILDKDKKVARPSKPSS